MSIIEKINLAAFKCTVAQLIYYKNKDYTMIPRDRYIANLTYAHWLKQQPNFPKGAIVECGTWKGGMIAGLWSVFGKNRHYIVFDSFQGLPKPTKSDGPDSHHYAAHPEHPRNFNNCTADDSFLKSLIARDKMAQNVTIIPGWYKATIEKNSRLNMPLAFLHLDSDWYEPTMICLKRLFPLVQPGGAVIVDDYPDWYGCRRALHQYIAKQDIWGVMERIGVNGGALIRIPPAEWSLKESPHLG